MTTFAQGLWQDVLRGVDTPEMAIHTFLSCTKTEDIQRQMTSMPPAMLQELSKFIATLATGEPGWDEQMLIFGTHQVPHMETASACNRRNAEEIQKVF